MSACVPVSAAEVKAEEPQFMSQIAGQIAWRLGSGSFARTSQRPSRCPNRKLASTHPEV